MSYSENYFFVHFPRLHLIQSTRISVYRVPKFLPVSRKLHSAKPPMLDWLLRVVWNPTHCKTHRNGTEARSMIVPWCDVDKNKS